MFGSFVTEAGEQGEGSWTTKGGARFSFTTTLDGPPSPPYRFHHDRALPRIRAGPDRSLRRRMEEGRLATRRLARGRPGLFAFVAPALSFAAFVDGPVALIAMAVTLAIPAALLVLSMIPPVACPCCERAFFSSAVTAMGTRASCASCGVVIGTPASQALASRAFPRAWLVPIGALFFASLVGSGVTRARRQDVRRRFMTICAPVAGDAATESPASAQGPAGSRAARDTK
jgi:hypothetical protein